MSSVTLVVLTTLLFVAMIGGIIGIILENERAQSPWRNPAIRDALLPVAGWASLFALHFAVVLVGEDNLPTWFKHLLGNLAVVLFYYAVLATLRLIWRSARRIYARVRSRDEAIKWLAIPVLGGLTFPTLFVSAVLAAVSAFLYEGFSVNFLFVLLMVSVLAVVRRRPVGS